MANPEQCTTSTFYVDSDNPAVRRLAERFLDGVPDDPRMKAIALFDGVRDGLRYDPYRLGLDKTEYRASAVATAAAAFCVPKAILLAAVARSAGIPAAVGFADVRNHLTSPKLMAVMGSDLFIYHGYVALWLDDRWIKVTPAFNMELCQRFGVKPLVFDGHNDALFHEFDTHDRPHMEYVLDRGMFVEPPVEDMLAAFTEAYPQMIRVLHHQGASAMQDSVFQGAAGPRSGMLRA